MHWSTESRFLLHRLGTLAFRHRSVSIAHRPNSQHFASGGLLYDVRLFDSATGEVLRTYKIKGSAESIQFDSTGRYLAVACTDGCVYLIDMQTEEVVRLRPRGSSVTAVRFIPNSDLLISCSGTEFAIRIWDVASRNIVSHFLPDIGECEELAIDNTGQCMASCGDEGLSVWKRTGEATFRRQLLSEEDAQFKAVAFSADNRHLIVGKSNGELVVWDVATLCVVRTLRFHQAEIHALAIKPHDNVVFSSDEDSLIHVWRDDTGEHIAAHRISQPLGPLLLSLDYHPTTDQLLIGGTDGIIRVLDSESLYQNTEHYYEQSFMQSANYCNDGRKVCTIGVEGAVRIWRADEAQLDRTLVCDHRLTHSLIVGDGRRILTVNDEGVFKILDFETHRVLDSFFSERGPVKSLDNSKDGGLLVCGNDDGTTSVWDLDSKRQTAVIHAHEDAVLSVALSADQNVVATGGRDGFVKLWDLTTNTMIKEFNRGCGGAMVYSVAIADNSHVAFVHGDELGGYVEVWDLLNEKRLIAKKSCRLFEAVALSPDGRFVAYSKRYPWQIRLLSLESNTIVATFRGHRDEISRDCLTFSPDSRYLLSGSADTTAIIWDVEAAANFNH